MKNLKDKVVLVTGGGAGFGKAIIERFVAEGCRAVVADCPSSEHSAQLSA